ncbi:MULTISPECIES: hypothetical protein [unclassified Sphingomonas]|jgi:hypothetical protein|uniref:hypothetical protein n=1 Tax=unclassified Sphingomonas TaxID=196159 RepID=UPI000B0CE163|nr:MULTISPECIES: hypothetical protein [unclassified Sphingomonas]
MHGKIDFSVLRITAATSAALLASGCGGGALVANQPTQMCVDGAGRRIGDANCGGARGGGTGGAHAYYVGRGQRVPEMGEVARGGSTRPSAGVSYSHVSARSVSRGGFGRSAGFHGGFGGA